MKPYHCLACNCITLGDGCSCDNPECSGANWNFAPVEDWEIEQYRRVDNNNVIPFRKKA